MTTKVTTLCIDDMSIIEITTLIGLCDTKYKYYRFGNNLKAAWRAVIRDGNYEALCSHVNLEHKKNPAPSEVVEAVKYFLVPKKLPEVRIKAMLESNIPHGFYKTEFTKVTKAKEDIEYERFRQGLKRYLNSKTKTTRIRVTLRQNNGTQVQRVHNNRNPYCELQTGKSPGRRRLFARASRMH